MDDAAEAETPPLESAMGRDVPQDAAPNAKAPAAKRPGRGLAYLALLLSLAAGAGVGYQYWSGIDRDARIGYLLAELAEARDARRRVVAVAGEAERTRAQLQRVQAEQARQNQALADARNALAEAAAAAPVRQSPRPQAWRLTEVEHLLRAATTHLLLQRDAAVARRLLASADEILAELDDFALHDVRALLAEDLAALADYRGADVPGVFLRLEALRGLLDDLPVRLPAFTGSQPASADGPVPNSRGEPAPADESEDGDRGLLQAVAKRLAGLVRFRRDQNVRPLLPPAQAEYLQQRLRLAVDRAQLAALRRDQAMFDATLATADEWLRSLAPEARIVQRLRADLAALRQVELAVPPPDLSRPLAHLRALRAGVRPSAASVTDRDDATAAAE